MLLAASGGQPLAALQRQALGLDAALWTRLPALVAAGDAQPLAKLPVALVVESLQKLCHDAMLAACGVAPRYLPGGQRAAARPTCASLTAWAQALRRVARHADHPWNAALMLESLVLQGRQALGGERAAGRRRKSRFGTLRAMSEPTGRKPAAAAPAHRRRARA